MKCFYFNRCVHLWFTTIRVEVVKKLRWGQKHISLLLLLSSTGRKCATTVTLRVDSKVNHCIQTAWYVCDNDKYKIYTKKIQ